MTAVKVKPIMKPSEIDPTPEPIWYFRSKRLYNGKFPPFYDVSDMPGTQLLLDNYEAIREEVLAFYSVHGDEIPSQMIPYNYEDPGWKTLSLYSFGYKDRTDSAKLPILTGVLEQIPNMVGATVSILNPGVRIHAHVGATSAIIRTHLGIRIPGEPPEVAIHVGGHTRGWEDGGLFGIEMARRHLAWNNTEHARIAITVDTVKDEYAHRCDQVSGRSLALMVMWLSATRWPITRRLPQPVLAAIHTCGAIGATAMIKGRRRLGLQPPLVIVTSSPG